VGHAEGSSIKRECKMRKIERSWSVEVEGRIEANT